MAKKTNKVNKMKRRSIKSLINMDVKEFNKLTRDELQVAVEKMRNNALRKVETFVKHEMSSPAVIGYLQSSAKNIVGYDVRTRDAMQTFMITAQQEIADYDNREKNLQELRREFVTQKKFLSAKTNTLKGYKEYKKNVINELKNEGINISEEQYSRFFFAYERLAEIEPSVKERGFKYNILKTLSEYTEDERYDMDDIISRMVNEIEEIYERNQEIDNADDFFTLDEWEW